MAGWWSRCDSQLRAALLDVAASDAYAARDILSHESMRSQMTRQQDRELSGILAAAGLGTGSLPAPHMDALTAAVNMADNQLRTLLAEARRS